MRRWGLWLIALNLAGLIALAFAWPQFMVAPGPLIPAHASIAGDCFACHTPFKGVSASRCIACHTLSAIGIRKVGGTPIRSNRSTVAFHQMLAKPDCTACHTDHSAPRLVEARQSRFAHDLLRADARGRCSDCHRAPPTPLHRQASSNCASCHVTTAWKPATFDHRRFFTLDGPHDAPCATCHTGGTFTRYTCFGCHEHRPEQIRAIHAEEGIGNISNCARCHRSGEGEGGEGDEGD